MNSIPISSAPLPNGNIAGASPSSNATDIDNNTASLPFASLLAHKMVKPQPPSAFPGSGTQGFAISSPLPDKTAADALNAALARIPIELREIPANAADTKSDTPVADDTTASPQDQAAIPVNAPNVILPHIPVEMRGTTIIEESSQPMSGNRSEPTAPTSLASGAASDTPLSTPAGPRDSTPFQIELSGTNSLTDTAATTKSRAELPAQDTLIQSLTNPETKTASETAQELLAAPEVQLLRQEAVTSPPQPNSPQMNAAPISQATISAMSGLPTGNTAPVTTLTISTPLDTPAWAEDFTQKISWQISQKIQVAELHLNPANLGPLDIVLKISDNQATAQFTSPHAAVREAVENALPKLREMLSDNGIMLSNASVGDQSAKQRNMEEFAGKKGGASSGRAVADAAAEASTVSPTLSARRHNGMVDTFA